MRETEVQIGNSGVDAMAFLAHVKDGFSIPI